MRIREAAKSPDDVFAEVARILSCVIRALRGHGIVFPADDQLVWSAIEAYGNCEPQMFQTLLGSHGFELAIGYIIPKGQSLRAPLAMDAACRIVDVRNSGQAALVLAQRTGSNAWGLRQHKLLLSEDWALIEIAAQCRLTESMPFAFLRDHQALLGRFAQLFHRGY